MSCSLDGFDELQLLSSECELLYGTTCGVQAVVEDGCGSLHSCSAPCPPFECRSALVEGIALRICGAVAPPVELSDALVQVHLLHALSDVLTALVTASRVALCHGPARPSGRHPRRGRFVRAMWAMIRAKTLSSLSVLKQCKLVLHA